MKLTDKTKDVINEEIEKVKTEVDDVTEPVTKDEIANRPFDRIIDGAYTFSSYIPIGGKYATATFDKLKFKERAKNFSNRAFNPFFISKKIKSYFSKSKK